ncbi:redoxin domain-containing protein [Pedobacter deserti]|uniref:redoxin domain-containing protein n=1 Tax=Pedobacter deserti TaxID=2817382 RepID=UPI00210C38C5|nr:redoxin domain-containing protein [Pedobacter sp. SYSU D00382]
MKVQLSLVFALLLSMGIKAQTLNLPKNYSFEIQTTQTDKGSYPSEITDTYAFKSLGRNKDGDFMLECKLVNATYGSSQMGGTLLNTDKIRETDFRTTAILKHLALLDKPFQLTISPEGKVLAVSGAEEIVKQRFAVWKIAEETSKGTLEYLAAAIKAEMQALFFDGKTADVAQAQTANKLEGETKISTVNSTARTTTYQTSNQIGDVQADRKFVIDKKTGLVKESRAQSKTQFKQSPQPGISSNARIDVSTVQKLQAVSQRKPLDTAWINMAVRFSYWSDALKESDKYDSTRVFALFKKPDSRFVNDNYYIQNRLSALQRVDGDKADLMYDSLLSTTPNKSLKGNYIHLVNKLSFTYHDEQDVASLYDLTTYAAETEAFESWLQSSFCQAISAAKSPGELDGKIDKAYVLSGMMLASKDAEYLKKVRPLAIWSRAKQASSAEAAIAAAKTFHEMSDQDIQAGNGSRYALLVYQMLQAAGRPVEAGALLDGTIARLERFTADSLSARKYLDKNLLAGAYYLKFLRDEAKGDGSAFRSLSKAAQYSPASSKEKAHMSFYDRALLDTKEGYRDLFIEKLLAVGNEAEASDVFVTHITAMPEQILEMKKLYEEKFKKDDFSAFFQKRIVSGWPAAPTFALAAVNGGQHSLADFKGKWLVMDFWGTWCGPCRAEMPDVNRFSDEVKDGKHKNVQFLSVACNDQEDKVKAYLEENNFGIPVAMSDGIIQRNYSIRGYPSKIIVSPEGKMIQVDFGKDWKKVITAFSQL